MTAPAPSARIPVFRKGLGFGLAGHLAATAVFAALLLSDGGCDAHDAFGGALAIALAADVLIAVGMGVVKTAERRRA